MERTLNNIDAHIIDPQNKFTDNVPKSSGKVTFNTKNNLLTIEFPPPPTPSDIDTLKGGHPSGIKAKRNNRNEVYSIVFNLTPQALSAFGKKEIKNELLACFDSIWTDHESHLS